MEHNGYKCIYISIAKHLSLPRNSSMWLLDLNDSYRFVSWCRPSFQITIRAESLTSPWGTQWRLKAAPRGGTAATMRRWDRHRWLCCWRSAAGWVSNEWLAGVSGGGWIVKRNLGFTWRKTKWWIIQRPDSPGILRSPNLLRRGERAILGVYLFLCWRRGERV